MRFVDFNKRYLFSVISHYSSSFIEEYIQKIMSTKLDLLKWKGLTLMKDPMSLSTYLQLLQDLTPKTILEFGTWEGGTALWMHDMLESLNVECSIHTFDINKSRVNLPDLHNVTFHQLDNFKIYEFIERNKYLFESFEHPILAIEDSHTNVHELLTAVDEYLIPEDYLIVEDTLGITSPWRKCHIYKALEKFMTNNKYVVDTHYCDFWGYNNSWNVNSFLKKTKS